MKVVILGGGIAGLTVGAFLQQNDVEISIFERSMGMPLRGHAFLMHADGLSLLKELNRDKQSSIPGERITSFSLNRPEGREIKHLQLKAWQCIKRKDLIQYLFELFDESVLKVGHDFTGFIYEGEKAIAASFANGHVEYGDVFIGADGANSKVRDVLFGKVKFTPVQVKEVVGIAPKALVTLLPEQTFSKFQHESIGLAFGVIPASNNECVWFLQYDATQVDIPETTPEAIETFCKEQLKDFPPLVQEVMACNDFQTSYIWNTRDFDLLPRFHKGNVALIGDAAHQALPFTSAGTTNAILDAKNLTNFLLEGGDVEFAFNKYYASRSVDVAKHIELGRELKRVFLFPKDSEDDDIPVPLIAQKENDAILSRAKEIQVLYFTDPICSTCWIIQPLLRKLQLEYGKHININYCMGGLLPSWEEYELKRDKVINKPSDAAKHWEEVCALHEMPLDGDVWIEDPLPSSFPPSIAFKAAQMQDTDKAILFLRRIKEMVFLEKKNIIKWDHLQNAALEVGLDSARLLRDFNGKAKVMFRDDLVLAAKLGVVGFPTLFFSNTAHKKVELRGYQPYEKFEEIIHELMPGVKKVNINPDPLNLFMHFPSMTAKEFSFLSGQSIEDTAITLKRLYDDAVLDKYESKNGAIWFIRNTEDE